MALLGRTAKVVWPWLFPKQDLLTKNPCDFCKPPKRVKTPINALTRDERNRMLRLAREAQPQPLAIAIELALTTGMRRGEVCALRWSDLNDEGTITVRRALAHADGGYYIKEPKTGSSIRTIPLTPYMRNLLGAMRDDTKHMFERLSANFKQADPYILGTQTTDSRPYNPDRFDKDFGSFCKITISTARSTTCATPSLPWPSATASTYAPLRATWGTPT